MVALRRVVQVAFLALFLVLLVLTVRPMTHWPVQSFLLASPFIAVMALLAGVVGAWMLLGLALLLLTALFGRFFCGWVCPLGTTIDMGEKVLFRFRGRRIGTPRLRLVKYGVLAAAMTLAALHVGAGGWLDPICIATRTYTSVIYPVGGAGLTWAADRISPPRPAAPRTETAPATGAASAPEVAPATDATPVPDVTPDLPPATAPATAPALEDLPVAPADTAPMPRPDALPDATPMPRPDGAPGALPDTAPVPPPASSATPGWLERYRLTPPTVSDVLGEGHRPSYRGTWVFGVALLGIVLLSFYQRRFWCRNVCPLGAMLGLVARASRLRVRVDERCINCGKCQRQCKTGAFFERPDRKRQAVESECIRCWACTKTMCPVDAIRIRGSGVGGRGSGERNQGSGVRVQGEPMPW